MLFLTPNIKIDLKKKTNSLRAVYYELHTLGVELGTQLAHDTI